MLSVFSTLVLSTVSIYSHLDYNKILFRVIPFRRFCKLVELEITRSTYRSYSWSCKRAFEALLIASTSENVRKFPKLICLIFVV